MENTTETGVIRVGMGIVRRDPVPSRPTDNQFVSGSWTWVPIGE